MTADWLNMGGLAAKKFESADEMRSAEFSGVLRGVQKISFGKLARALTMHVIELDGPTIDTPFFLVIPVDSDGTDENGRARKRGTQWHDLYPDDPEGEYVCLYDRQIEPCFCSDQTWRGDTYKTPCAHILAALVHMKHPQILPYVAELAERNRIAAAMKETAA